MQMIWKKIKFKIYFSSQYKWLVRLYNPTLNFKALRQKANPHTIPIIINNFNQYKGLLSLIQFLKSRGYHNIIILDNNSAFPPLLEFYGTTELEVIRLKENVGHLAFWEEKISKRFSDGYYVLTDPDVVPIDDCPQDFLEKFLHLLLDNPEVTKVGFGLKIDDLPDYLFVKEQVEEWEAKFWKNEIEPNVYKADIDTTFALYRPHHYVFQQFYAGIRTGGKYIARHLGWYIDEDNLTEEEHFYRNTAHGSSSWLNTLNEIISKR